MSSRIRMAEGAIIDQQHVTDCLDTRSLDGKRRTLGTTDRAAAINFGAAQAVQLFRVDGELDAQSPLRTPGILRPGRMASAMIEDGLPPISWRGDGFSLARPVPPARPAAGGMRRNRSNSRKTTRSGCGRRLGGMVSQRRQGLLQILDSLLEALHGLDQLVRFLRVLDRPLVEIHQGPDLSAQQIWI